MKTPFRFFIHSILLALSVQVFAQVAEEENIMLQQITVAEKALLLSQYTEVNTLSIKQDGLNNQVFMVQAGSNNTAIHQTGPFNHVFLQQSISGGSLKLFQTGESNQYRGIVTGTDIEISVMQQGGFNTIEHFVAGEQLNFIIIQEGNRNTIQNMAESTGLPLQIHQSGSDLKLIVKSNN